MTPFIGSIRRTSLLNRHLELVPAFHDSLYFTLYKTDITRGWTIRAGPKERELTVQPNGVFQNSYSVVRLLKRCVFRDRFYRKRVYGRPNWREKNLHFQEKTDIWTGPMFADIISVYNGNIKHMGRGLKLLALERALQSFPVHP